MIGFSKYLQSFMKRNEISMVELSKETNIDRTVIYRYVKGTRVPSDINVVIRIADAMQMSIREKKHLLEEYDKLIFGEAMVYSFQYIQKLMKELEKLGREDNLLRNQWSAVRELKIDTPVIELNTKEEIVNYILNLFQYVADQSDISDKIYLVMQPVYHDIQKFIPQIFKNSNIKIEQVVCLEQNLNQSYENLQVLQEILPACFALSEYEIYYYYDVVNSHINRMSVMPNLLVIHDQVIQFDYKMKHGIVVKDAAYAKAMCKQYAAIRRDTCNLCVRGSATEIFYEYNQTMGIIAGMLSGQVCMGACIGREILEKNIYPIPGKKEFIDSIIEIHGDWEEMQYLHTSTRVDAIVSYGSYRGVKDFMRTGRITELPDALYLPLSPEERRLVLQRMIVLVRLGKIRYRFISDEINLPQSVQVYWAEKQKKLIINQVLEDEMRRITVDEHSIYKTFQYYLEYLEKKELLCSEEESQQYLVELLKKSDREIHV